MMTTEILDVLLRLNVAGSGAIIAVLLLRGLLRRVAGSRLTHRLWILVPIAAAAAFLPVRLAPPPLATLDALLGAVQLSAPAPWAPISSILVAGWGLGVLMSLGLVVSSHRRFLKMLGRLQRRPDGARQCEAATLGPAVVGLVSPRIVLPADFETRFTPEEQSLILAHERRHINVGDLRLNGLAVLGLCLNWFNPLAYLALHLFRADQELACDEVVMRHWPGQRTTYAQALLKTELGGLAPPLGCSWPSRGPHPLAMRIAMLKRTPPGRLQRLAGVVALASAAVVSAYAAWAVQPPRYASPARPSYDPTLAADGDTLDGPRSASRLLTASTPLG